MSRALQFTRGPPLAPPPKGDAEAPPPNMPPVSKVLSSAALFGDGIVTCYMPLNPKP